MIGSFIGEVGGNIFEEGRTADCCSILGVSSTSVGVTFGDNEPGGADAVNGEDKGGFSGALGISTESTISVVLLDFELETVTRAVAEVEIGRDNDVKAGELSTLEIFSGFCIFKGAGCVELVERVLTHLTFSFTRFLFDLASSTILAECTGSFFSMATGAHSSVP
jgi:hypothetical protein